MNALRLRLARWLLPKGWHVQRNRPKKVTALDLKPWVSAVGFVPDDADSEPKS